MIKVSVMYPNKPGARFDHAYYRDKHMPLLKALSPPNHSAWFSRQANRRMLVIVRQACGVDTWRL